MKKIKKVSFLLLLLDLFLLAGNRASAQFQAPMYGAALPKSSSPSVIFTAIIYCAIPLVIIAGAVVYIFKRKRNAEKTTENRDGSDPEILSGQKQD